MKKTLIVIDMQNDFVFGCLGTKEAEAIVEKVKKKIEKYRNNGDEVVFTRDTHDEGYLQTNEGKMLPVMHCIKGTDGWQLIDGIYQDGDIVINKPTFGYLNWQKRSFDFIELIGVCTDICVISNALILKAAFPEVPISVDAECCAGVTPKKHDAALEAMESCQIEIKNQAYATEKA